MAPRPCVPATPIQSVRAGGMPADTWFTAQMRSWTAPKPEGVTRSYEAAAALKPKVGGDNLAYAHLKKTNAANNNVSNSPNKPLAWKKKEDVKLNPYTVLDDHALLLGKAPTQSVCGLKDEKPGPQAAGKPHLSKEAVMMAHHKEVAEGLSPYKASAATGWQGEKHHNGGDSKVTGFYRSETCPRKDTVRGVGKGLTGGTGGMDIATSFYAANREVFAKAATPFGVGAGQPHAGLDDFTAAKQLDFQKEASAAAPEAMAHRQLHTDLTPTKSRVAGDSFFAAHATRQQQELTKSSRQTQFSLEHPLLQ